MSEVFENHQIEIVIDEAWKRHQRILKLRDGAMSSFLELGKELYEFKTNNDFESLGYDCFESYVNSTEVNIGRSSAFRLIGIYLTFQVQLGVPPVGLLPIGLAKLEDIRGKIEKENQEELLAQAETLSRYDLRRWLKLRFRPDKGELPKDLVPMEGKSYHLIHGDMRQVCTEFPDESFDAIVTDPPYPGEYLPLFEALALAAKRLLVPGGTMLVMSGQTHLPEVLMLMTKHITYRWTIAYLTPGKETRIWGRQIWTHWKPVLVFSKSGLIGDWAVDVVTSPAPDKEYHYWGQSLQGMRGLIDSFVLPNSRILDPFCGGGATIEAALDLGHECVGIDNDAEAILAIQERLNDKARKNRLA